MRTAQSYEVEESTFELENNAWRKIKLFILLLKWNWNRAQTHKPTHTLTHTVDTNEMLTHRKEYFRLLSCVFNFYNAIVLFACFL